MLSIALSTALVAVSGQGLIAASVLRPACRDASITDLGELRGVLSMRLVEIFRRARNAGRSTDVELKQLVDPNAEFDLGAGDVGRPLGRGIPGARKMALEMRAVSFRYPLWTDIPTRVDPCSKQGVIVDFFDPATGAVARVEGEFSAGALISAKGWMQRERSGKF